MWTKIRLTARSLMAALAIGTLASSCAYFQGANYYNPRFPVIPKPDRPKLVSVSADETNKMSPEAQKAVADTLAEKSKADAERLKQLAEVEAVRLKTANDVTLSVMELKHRRSMLRVTFAGAILTMLAGTGIFTAVQTLLSTRAAQSETQKTLKRIEAKQAKAVEP